MALFGTTVPERKEQIERKIYTNVKKPISDGDGESTFLMIARMREKYLHDVVSKVKAHFSSLPILFNVFPLTLE